MNISLRMKLINYLIYIININTQFISIQIIFCQEQTSTKEAKGKHNKEKFHKEKKTWQTI
jgi:hypothetical protein